MLPMLVSMWIESVPCLSRPFVASASVNLPSCGSGVVGARITVQPFGALMPIAASSPFLVLAVMTLTLVSSSALELALLLSLALLELALLFSLVVLELLGGLALLRL